VCFFCGLPSFIQKLLATKDGHGRTLAKNMKTVSVYFASGGKTCGGAILPLFEHAWLKWSYDEYDK